VDAVLSTTALHWLLPEALVQLYHQLGLLVRPGGVVQSGDQLGFAPHLSSFRKVTEWSVARQTERVKKGQGGETWEEWWRALRAETRPGGPLCGAGAALH
jgi:hypothetical protein